MIHNLNRVALLLASLVFLTGGSHGGEQGEKSVEMLARHDTVAEFKGTRYHRCMGRTGLCPDKCGNSGSLATFRIVHYIAYEKPGQYGDPKREEFAFLVEDNMNNRKVSPEMHAAINALEEGDVVMLSWEHNYVRDESGARPERPLTRLEKIAPVGSQEWLHQIDRFVDVHDADGNGPTVGSSAWMQAVSAELGVYDDQGHGPTPGSDEWRNAVHWKAFGLRSGQ